jgi:hypothetical protein
MLVLSDAHELRLGGWLFNRLRVSREQRAADHFVKQRAETTTFRLRAAHNLFDRRSITEPDGTAGLTPRVNCRQRVGPTRAGTSKPAQPAKHPRLYLRLLPL